MKPTTPNLLTLLRWADRLRRGQACAEFEAWRAEAEDGGEWQQILRAQQALDAGRALVDARLMQSEEELAAWVDETLDVQASQGMEVACWASDPQLAEALSAASFLGETDFAEPSRTLEKRLLAMGPPGRNGHAVKLAGALECMSETLPARDAETPSPSSAIPVTTVEPAARGARVKRIYVALAVAGLVLIAFSAGVGWLAGRRPVSRNGRDVATSLPEVGPKEHLRKEAGDPKTVAQPNSPDSLAKSPEAGPEQRTDDSLPQPSPGAVVEKAASPSMRSLPIVEGPREKIDAPADAQPATLVIKQTQGVLLVANRATGVWIAAPKSLALNEPVHLASLTDGWATAEIPGVGTLVLEGPVEALIAMRPDKLLEVQLKHGKLGIEQFAAGALVRFETTGATWTARGVSGYSTIAIFDDPLTPALVVAQGEVAVEDARVLPQQGLQWQEGVPQSFAVQTSGAGGQHDLGWMHPPEERLRKAWTSFYGKLAQKVAEAADAAEELNALLAASRDPRQTALLTQWNLELADEVARPKQEWNLLNDRREQARVAAVQSLLELPASDPRLARAEQYWRGEVGEETTKRISEWLALARRPVPAAPPQALDLVDHLAHKDLAVRQIAVTLLELKTAPLFQLISSRPPPFDAAGPASVRIAAQNEWRMTLRQLYAKYRGNPAILAPSSNKPIAPGTMPQK